MNADEITGELVHLEMRHRRIPQAELGNALGISAAAVGRKLYGTRSWTLDELITTARFLGVAVTDLLPGNDYAPVLEGRGRVTVRASRDSNPQPSGWEYDGSSWEYDRSDSESDGVWTIADDAAFIVYAEAVRA